MANYKAVANGNWSALATWQDNSSGVFLASTVLPGASDVVYFNNFTVQMDVDATVLEIRNNTATGVTAGGSGVISASRTVNANLFHATGNLITISANSPSVVNITGNMPGTSVLASNLVRGINITGSCTLNYTGNIVGTLAAAAGGTCAIQMGTNSTVNLTGNVAVGITGGNTETNTFYGINTATNSTLNIVGDVTGGVGTQSFGFGVYVGVSGANVNVTGNVYGGQTVSTRTTYGIFINSVVISNVNIVGGLIAGPYAFALYYLGQAGTKPIFSGNIVNQPDGHLAVLSSYLLINGSVSQWEFRNSSFNTNTLYAPGVATGFPATTNVKTGIAYGPTNNLTGTCAVPPAAAVSLGVPVDNTVGTASLDANALAIALNASLSASLAPALTTSLNASLSASLPLAIAPLLWDEAVTNITTPNSIGERLKNCSTVATTGAQIASFNP
jgi:hypothetical protein